MLLRPMAGTAATVTACLRRLAEALALATLAGGAWRAVRRYILALGNMAGPGAGLDRLQGRYSAQASVEAMGAVKPPCPIACVDWRGSGNSQMALSVSLAICLGGRSCDVGDDVRWRVGGQPTDRVLTVPGATW